jgi:protein-L-isoaspartate(D-aspartate) O-methyltransferase
MKQRPSFPARMPPSDAPKAKTMSAGAGTAQGVKPLSAKRAPTLGSGGAALAAPVPTGLGLDSSAVRASMVRKLAASGVGDAQVLAAMGLVPRHQFVDSALVTQAYEDTSLPIGLGQTISKPSVVARMIELLRQGALLQANGQMGRVLEIGTGCGYQAAVLSCVAREVYSIERLRGLHDKARDNLRPLRLPNVHLLFGDGMLGYAKGAPYAAIIAAAGGEAVPQAWLDQLAVGGRVIAPTVTANGQQALVVIDKTAQGLKQQQLEPVHFVPLKSGIA